MSDLVVHLSHSKMEMLSRCGEQYRRRYMLGERRPPRIALVRGIAVDAAVGADLTAKMNAGELLPEEAVLQTARDAFAREWEAAGEVELSAEERAAGEARAKGRATDDAVALSRLHHRRVAPGLSPTAIQHRFRVEVRGLDVVVSGVVDVEEEHALWDTKTSARRFQRDAAEKSMQLTTYALAERALSGQFPETVGLHGLVAGQRPEVQVLTSTRGPDDLAPFVARLDAAAAAIRAGVFHPADPNAIASPCGWCGWRPVCRYVRQPVSAVVAASTLHPLGSPTTETASGGGDLSPAPK